MDNKRKRGVMMSSFRKQNKFLGIRLVLKSEIFSFIPIDQKLNSLFKINKKFNLALNLDESIIKIKTPFKILSENNIKVSFNNTKEVEAMLREYGNSDTDEVKKLILYYLNISYKGESLLDLAEQRLSEASKKSKIFYISEFLKLNNSINYINLSNNFFGNNNFYGLKALCEALQANISVRELNFSSNFLGQKYEDMKIISLFLAKNKTIEKINLSDNNLGSNSYCLEALFDVLRKNSTMKEINLKYNKLGILQVNLLNLKKILVKNKSIEKLDISCNSLNANIDNIKCLCSGFKKNKTLKEINLSYNSLDRKSVV